MGGGGPGGGFGLERSTSSNFFAASRARLLRASSCNCLTSPSLKAKRSRMGTPACVTIMHCGARRRKLSVLGRSRESLVVRNVSLDLFSFWYMSFVTELLMERLPQQGPTPSGAAPQCKHALSSRTLYDYHRCRDCPSRLRRPLCLERPSAPPPHPTVAHAHPSRPRAVDAASWS